MSNYNVQVKMQDSSYSGHECVNSLYFFVNPVFFKVFNPYGDFETIIGQDHKQELKPLAKTLIIKTV